MFGETPSESPRLPSPWLSRSTGGTTPSPLTPATPDSGASSSSSVSVSSGRRRSSLEALDLFHGLADDLDSFSLTRGTHRLSYCASPAMEEILVKDEGMQTLEPEVDHQGHIEYKLKLLTPRSLHRLEKLRTQLKWRLVEGGGVAVYELGVLDDGTLVGLVQDDMDESLRTLGQMLAGLGGGTVQVTRVVRLGCGKSTEGAAAETASPLSTSPGAVFPSFEVPFETDDLAFVMSASTYTDATPAVEVVTDPDTGAISILHPKGERGPTPMLVPNHRTADEQAERRRAKRDLRRQQRREATSACTHLDGHPLGSFQATHPQPIPPKSKPPKPPKPARTKARGVRRSTVTDVDSGVGASSGSSSSSSSSYLPPSDGDGPLYSAGPHPCGTPAALSAGGALPTVAPIAPRGREGRAPKSPEGGDSLYKPAVLKEGDTEVRYVVEAVVTKAGGSVRSAAQDRDSTTLLAATSGPRRKSERKGLPGARTRPAVEQDRAGYVDSAAIARDPDDLESGAGQGEKDEQANGSEDDDDDDALDVAGEGWSFLEFDLEQLASSVKAAAAAAAAAAPAPTAAADTALAFSAAGDERVGSKPCHCGPRARATVAPGA